MQTENQPPPGHGFGTAPVFLASISTILGAILFLRFGYAVGHAGLAGALGIVVLGHLVTIPTALAISEIATNRRVEGGGEYFIISRSFGVTLGGAIGVPLYLSQALSVGFYAIAFAESFRPLAPLFERVTGMPFDPRIVSVPAVVLLVLVVAARGARVGVGMLWGVFAVLALSILLFLLGGRVGSFPVHPGLFSRVTPHDPLMLVFAIVFPAFTGLTAGVGLSGDLASARRSIPRGVLSATLTGMVVYVCVVWKLAFSAPPEALAGDPLIMSRIALWGPIIPMGLACATASSAIGSVLVAPRTLQALAADRIAPVRGLNDLLARGAGPANDPRNATLLTGLIAVATVAGGTVDFVARIISMFFILTYGSLCAVSFLEHLASSPGYRPTFRSRGWVSLVGAVMCLLLMFQMDPVYALLALAAMVVLYRIIRRGRGTGTDDLASLLRGVMMQLTRRMHLVLQKTRPPEGGPDWRPSAIMVNGRTFERAAPFQLFSWLCHRYAFGTYLHFLPGRLEPATYDRSREALDRLVRMTGTRRSGVYVDTMVSPSNRTALAQSLQLPGVAGMENNTVLLEFSVHDPPEVREEVLDGCRLASAVRMNTIVLRHGERFFGDRRQIHVWFTWHDHSNMNLMILLPYILAGHPDWRSAEIRVFAAFPHSGVEEQRRRLHELITTGRIPIREDHVTLIGTDDRVAFEGLVETRSRGADLVVFGFNESRLEEKGTGLFLRFPSLGEVLFVCARESIRIE